MGSVTCWQTASQVSKHKEPVRNTSDNYFSNIAKELKKAEIKALSELNLHGEGITIKN